MEGIKVACGLITWKHRGQLTVPEGQVMQEIVQAGYEGTQASPEMGRSAEETLAFFAQYGLKPAPVSLGVPLWLEGQRDEILERARAYAQFMHEVGCSELYIIASPLTRRELSGHVTSADAMSDDEFIKFADLLSEVGRVTLSEGVLSCFHNHVGSVIETREEIGRLFSLVDRNVVFQGADLGHLAWAGADPVGFCRDYADSIKTLHLKDINGDVLREGQEKKWDYGTFSSKGIFAELGEGIVDFAAIFELLQRASFKGWVITETDVTQKASAFESAAISRNYLKSIGV